MFLRTTGINQKHTGYLHTRFLNVVFFGSRIIMDGNLRRIRERKALSLKDLVQRSAVDQSTIYRLEVGRTRRPVGNTLRELADALGVDVEEHTTVQGNLGVWEPWN